MAAARAGAASAPIARRRSWISASRFRRRGLGLGQQREALGVALQHGVQQAGAARGRLLRNSGDAGAGGEPDVSAVQRHLARDRAQQRGLAGAVAADQADAAPLIHGQVGSVQDVPSTKPDRGAGNDKEGHGGG